ncbi:MAG: OmpA family protein [Rhodobacteraceae bacterium]|nr:OmpA family protein [Paracoccaceae bacterium]
MRCAVRFFSAICFMLAAYASWLISGWAVTYLENETQTHVGSALLASGQNWATIRTDGLLVHLTGFAPDETARLRTIEVIGQMVDTRRLHDSTAVLQLSGIQAPRFSLEVLRNRDRISLIGLIPARAGRAGILGQAEEIVDGGIVTDMLESAEYAMPAGWQQNLDFGMTSLAALPRSKISITPENVRITAVAESSTEKAQVEQFLTRTKPGGTNLVMHISAPRPVISPFRFRMTMSEKEVRLLDCSADTDASRARILRAVAKAGLEGKGICNVGLGVPTTDWDVAVIQSIAAMRDLGGGTLTFTDSDISLVARNQVTQEVFDQVIGQLENELPQLFSLHAVLPPEALKGGDAAGQKKPEFSATLSPEGMVQLRGRVPNDLSKQSIEVYAKSLFGENDVYEQTRIDAQLPDGWPGRILAGLEGLSQLDHGIIIVRDDLVSIRGVGAREDIPAEVSRIFATRLGDARDYKIQVAFDQNLIPKQPDIESRLKARDCETRINAVLDARQIAFAPSSTDIEAESRDVLDAIAEILHECPEAEFVIEGHTDSRGREEMNLNLSQNRAEAVLSGLIDRRVLTAGITAKGYGEAQPVADNSTEEGRAANRRIAFRLLLPETEATRGDAE